SGMGSAKRRIPNVRFLRGAAHGTGRTFRAVFIFARRQASVDVETQLRAVRLLTTSLSSNDRERADDLADCTNRFPIHGMIHVIPSGIQSYRAGNVQRLSAAACLITRRAAQFNEFSAATLFGFGSISASVFFGKIPMTLMVFVPMFLNE